MWGKASCDTLKGGVFVLWEEECGGGTLSERQLRRGQWTNEQMLKGHGKDLIFDFLREEKAWKGFQEGGSNLICILK